MRTITINTACPHSFQNETGLWDQRAVERVRFEPAIALEQCAKQCGDLPMPITLVARRK
jgi:hypothetical protein